MADQRKSTCGDLNRRQHYGGTVPPHFTSPSQLRVTVKRSPQKHVRGIWVYLLVPVTSGEHGQQLSTLVIPLIRSFLSCCQLFIYLFFEGRVRGDTP